MAENDHRAPGERMRTPTRAAFLFITIGICLVLGSVLLGQSGYKISEAVSLNLGIVALAIVLVDLLWRVAGGSPIDQQIQVLSEEVDRLGASVGILDRAKRIGLENAHDRQADFGTQADWERLVESALKHVDVMGRTSHGWTKSKKMIDLIVRRVIHDDVAFRWLVMSEHNEFLSLLKEGGSPIGPMLTGKLREVQAYFQKVRERLPAEAQTRFQVRVFTDTPSYCAIVRIDDRCLVTQYLSSRNSHDSPFLEFRGIESSWPKAYVEEFEAIWGTAHEVPNPTPS